MKKFLAFTLAFMMLLTTPVFAAEEESDLAYVQDKGTLVVGITEFDPMDYRDEDGEWIGFDADMAKAFAESLGVDVEFIEIEWDNKVLELDAKTIDVAMLRQQVTDLLATGRMETTVTRAKEIRPLAERMITLGKKKGLANYRLALKFLTREDVAKKVFDDLAVKYADRNGGYTRITRTGTRRGDAAEMAVIELV